MIFNSSFFSLPDHPRLPQEAVRMYRGLTEVDRKYMIIELMTVAMMITGITEEVRGQDRMDNGQDRMCRGLSKQETHSHSDLCMTFSSIPYTDIATLVRLLQIDNRWQACFERVSQCSNKGSDIF